MLKYERRPQTFSNHRKIIPAFHVGVFAVLILNTILSVVHLVRGIDFDTLMRVLMALALLTMFFAMRVFPLSVQDRVIRLEMQLRLKELLPPDLRARIGELEVGQLVALRFASDSELPALVRDVLDQKISDRNDIKRRIREWRADYSRC